jgi:cytochrome c-type biogenesis protein CcmH
MLVVLMMLAGLTVAASPDQAVVEREAKQIERMLIAPCCWTQPVSDHYSAEADQIRAGIRAMLAAGKTRQQILDAYVAQYGERILQSAGPADAPSEAPAPVDDPYAERLDEELRDLD